MKHLQLSTDEKQTHAMAEIHTMNNDVEKALVECKTVLIEGCILPAIGVEPMETSSHRSRNIPMEYRASLNVRGLPISIEHHFRTSPMDKRPLKRDVVAGKVVDQTLKKDGSLWIKAEINPDLYDGQRALQGIKRGKFCGLSLTHVSVPVDDKNFTFTPVEVSICEEGARPHTVLKNVTMRNKKAQVAYNKALLESILAYYLNDANANYNVTPDHSAVNVTMASEKTEEMREPESPDSSTPPPKEIPYSVENAGSGGEGQVSGEKTQQNMDKLKERIKNGDLNLDNFSKTDFLEMLQNMGTSNVKSLQELEEERKRRQEKEEEIKKLREANEKHEKEKQEMFFNRHKDDLDAYTNVSMREFLRWNKKIGKELTDKEKEKKQRELQAEARKLLLKEMKNGPGSFSTVVAASKKAQMLEEKQKKIDEEQKKKRDQHLFHSVIRSYEQGTSIPQTTMASASADSDEETTSADGVGSYDLNKYCGTNSHDDDSMDDSDEYQRLFPSATQEEMRMLKRMRKRERSNRTSSDEVTQSSKKNRPETMRSRLHEAIVHQQPLYDVFGPHFPMSDVVNMIEHYGTAEDGMHRASKSMKEETKTNFNMQDIMTRTNYLGTEACKKVWSSDDIEKLNSMQTHSASALNAPLVGRHAFDSSGKVIKNYRLPPRKKEGPRLSLFNWNHKAAAQLLSILHEGKNTMLSPATRDSVIDVSNMVNTPYSNRLSSMYAEMPAFNAQMA